MPEIIHDRPEQDALEKAAQQVLFETVRLEALRRHKLYCAMRDDIEDGVDPAVKQEFCIRKLHEYAKDPQAFVRDFAWAHDPKGRFGSGNIPKNIIAPAGMVPVMPYPAQKEIIAMWHDFQTSPTEEAAVLEKSRQVYMTGLLAGWLPLHAWLFEEGGKSGLTSYDKELIDRGGKEQRTEETLFGSLRCYLDAMTTCVPQFRFNKRYASQRNADMVPCGLRGAQDVSMKITRPQWWVYRQRMFREAEGNFVVGDLPGDSMFRGMKLRNVLMDEFGQFNENRADVDRDSWASSQATAKNRIAWGTLPKKGGTASFFYQLLHNEDFARIARQVSLHWSEIYPYMAGARWTCRACGNKNEHPPNEPPGRRGIVKTCERCDLDQRVVFKDMTSPWFEKMCALALGDRITIAREYQLDWMASQGDVLFSTLDHGRLVIPFRDAGSSITLEGFDPGITMKNTGSWVAARFCPKSRRICVFGYWMSINPHPEYWVPFLKHWSRQATMRNRIVYGKMAGRTFMDAFDYPEEALRIMDHVSHFPLGEIRGDKFGSHQNAGQSIYDVLWEYNINVDWVKTPDREELVRNGVGWGARLSLDEKIAEIEPPSPFGTRFPSILACFQTAMPKQTEGEGIYKLDVSKKLPNRFVNNAIDAWLYLTRDLDEVHAVVSSGGDWGAEPWREAEIVDFGGDFPEV